VETKASKKAKRQKGCWRDPIVRSPRSITRTSRH
jgi:hypothetical protein